MLGATSAQISVAGDYPSHVAVHIVGGRIGEGVILNANHVLTLASNVFHAVNRNVRLAPADISVSAGVVLISANPTGTLPVMRIFAHDHYNFHTGKFNVAVLRVRKKMKILWTHVLTTLHSIPDDHQLQPHS